MGLIGSAIGAAGAIFGGLKASEAMKNVANSINDQMKDNQAWYDRRYNEDATQRADAQRLLQMTEESIKKRNRQAAGTAAVMGSSEESVAAAKAANGEAMADATSRIAAQGDARKDQMERQYMQTKQGLQAQQNDLEKQKAAQIAQAIQGVAGAGAELPI